MNVMGTILAALDSAHQLWKIRGIQSRALLALSLEFDNGRHLTEASRERVIANISTFTLVSFLPTFRGLATLTMDPGSPSNH